MAADFTLHELVCFHAVATEGSFQAAAHKLHRTHPTVFAAVKNLESQLGLVLFDRSGYRVALTDDGRAFLQHARTLLQEMDGLKRHAAQLASGEESILRIVIGDLCPLPATLRLLRRFFDHCPNTHLHLHFEAISGPWERLLNGEADLIVHHIDKSDTRFEFIELGQIALLPVVAPGFLGFAITLDISPQTMRPYVQCVIRDTARHQPPRDYFMIEGGRRWSVTDQFMKREIILQGMGWGHMPRFLIDEDLREGRLLSLAGRHFFASTVPLVVARLRETPIGPIATQLWRYFEAQATGDIFAASAASAV